MNPTSIYFELAAFDPYHRADWEQRLAAWFSACLPARRADSAEDADLIVEPFGAHSLLRGNPFTTARGSHYRRFPEKTFAWDADDLPTGRLPGLYCSLHRRQADPARHRGFCYPLRMNDLVREFDPADATFLFGFSGNVTSPLRARLFAQLSRAHQDGVALLRRTECLFHRVYSRETDFERARYADDLRQCRFVLCPRGNGLSSIRLFETMEAGRVPVILSDHIYLPGLVDWSSCAVIVRERELASLPRILAAHEADWLRLARNARAQWEQCFSDHHLLPSLLREIESIRRARRIPESAQRFFFPVRILPHVLEARAKAAARVAQRWTRSRPLDGTRH